MGLSGAIAVVNVNTNEIIESVDLNFIYFPLTEMRNYFSRFLEDGILEYSDMFLFHDECWSNNNLLIPFEIKNSLIRLQVFFSKVNYLNIKPISETWTEVEFNTNHFGNYKGKMISFSRGHESYKDVSSLDIWHKITNSPIWGLEEADIEINNRIVRIKFVSESFLSFHKSTMQKAIDLCDKAIITNNKVRLVLW